MKRFELFVRMLVLFLVLGFAGSAGGCGSKPLSPTDQETANANIKKARVGRHQELKDAAKGRKSPIAERKAARRGTQAP